MKKIVVLLCVAILSLASIFALTGCNNGPTLVDGSFKYHIDHSWVNEIDVDGSFTVIDKNGDANEVYYTLKGYDKDGNELWSRDCQFNLNNGDADEDNAYTVSFYIWITTDDCQNTSYITLSNLKFERYPDNEWMGWTFGFLSLALTGGVIALFVISKINESKKKQITEQNSEEN